MSYMERRTNVPYLSVLITPKMLQEQQPYRELPSKRFAGEEGEERVGQRMAEAKGINPDITTEVAEEVKEIVMEVKEATAEVADTLLPGNKVQLVKIGRAHV